MELLPDRIASVVSQIGTDAFGRALVDLFDPELGISHCVAYERESPHHAPRVIVAAGGSEDSCAESLEFSQQWVAEDYRDDPILEGMEQLARAEPSVNYLDVRSAPARGDAHARMVEKYYDMLGIGEEVNFSVRTCSKVVSLSLYRKNDGDGFNPSQRQQLARLKGLMVSSVQRHAQLLAPGGLNEVARSCEQAADPVWAQSRADKLARLRSALLMDPCQLTLREAEICAYIVLGYKVLAISLILGISTNTVATHRKRAYSKLGLSSQTELFNVCLKHCV